MELSQTRSLEGVRVLDLSRLLPGPYATLVMADLGADVVKVEEPEGGDYLRQMPPMMPGGDESALFYALNRNKRSLTLDLKSDVGADALRRLVRSADVLVESFRPGVMERLGLGWERLREQNPRLIYCALTGYGQTGPDAKRAGHDLNYLARSGVLGYGGEPDALAMPGGQMADLGGSLFAVIAILAALHERARTGQGRFIDLAMTDASLAFVHMPLGARLAAGDATSPLARGRETLNGGYACYRPYRTKDGRFLAVGSLEPKFASRMLALVGRSDLLEACYDAGEEGLRARRALEAAFLERTLAEWMERFAEADVCVEPVREGDEPMRDPQLLARGLFTRAADQLRGIEVTHLATPLARGEPPRSPPPRLGAHSREVLEAAGLSPEELRLLGL